MVDKAYLLKQLKALLDIPSPTGMVGEAAAYVMNELKRLGYTAVTQTRRGHVRVRVKGKTHDPIRAVCSHLDTLGVMVAEVKKDGTLRLSKVASLSPRAAENARVTIHSATPLRGTILIPCSTAHSYLDTDINAHKADWDTMECRVDGDVQVAKVCVGDYVTLNTSVRIGILWRSAREIKSLDNFKSYGPTVSLRATDTHRSSLFSILLTGAISSTKQSAVSSANMLLPPKQTSSSTENTKSVVMLGIILSSFHCFKSAN